MVDKRAVFAHHGVALRAGRRKPGGIGDNHQFDKVHRFFFDGVLDLLSLHHFAVDNFLAQGDFALTGHALLLHLGFALVQPGGFLCDGFIGDFFSLFDFFVVTKSLKYNRNKIINNLTAVIQSIIAMDTTGTDVLKLQEQIKKIEGKRANLIDLYMSNLINKDEFTATRASCDAEIEELQSIIESVDKQREMIEQQQQLLKEIEDAIKEIVSGVEYEDEFYKHILDKMVVQDKDNIDVYLNLLPMKWSYTVAKASKKAVASEWNISEASLPISVSRPRCSSNGME